MPEHVMRQTSPCRLSKEQTEAIKHFVGMDEFYPNLWEVKRAGELFKNEIAKLAQEVASGETSADGAIDRAAVKVWSAARRYQNEKQAAQEAKISAAKQTEPKGINKLLRKFFHTEGRRTKRMKSA